MVRRCHDSSKCKSCKGYIFCFAVNWDDGYLAAVPAVLKKAVGEPCITQLQIAQSLAQLLKAVPAWMLAFGDANNQGGTALAGLHSFQVGICSQPHKPASQMVFTQLVICCSLVLVSVVLRQFDKCMYWLCLLLQPF